VCEPHLKTPKTTGASREPLCQSLVMGGQTVRLAFDEEETVGSRENRELTNSLPACPRDPRRAKNTALHQLALPQIDKFQRATTLGPGATSSMTKPAMAYLKPELRGRLSAQPARLRPAAKTALRRISRSA
jgi:hypothetical protein